MDYNLQSEAMKDCCAVTPDVSPRQRRVLHFVLWINFAMFLAELVAGIAGRSTALLADSADMLGDALVYGFSLYAVARGPVWLARAAMLKGTIMMLFSVIVLAEVAWKVARGVAPAAEVMGGVGLLALGANAVCLLLLWSRRGDDINMKSAWLCSRNDVAANVGVLLAAGGVAVTGSGWPDILVGLVIAALFVGAATVVLLEAVQALRLGPRPN
ncbi:MAG TPA: cation transporter [Methylomirabilota bacterium]|jgi:Co/Zn/Cd efflux system component